MKVVIVAPSAWEPARDAAVAGLSAAAARLTDAILHHLHDRHAGIAPRPAAQLACLLLGENLAMTARRSEADWPGVIRRLVDNLLPPGSPSAARPPATILPGLVPHALLDRVVLPLIDACQRRQQQCYLFGGEGHAVPPSTELEAYQSNQEDAIDQLCRALPPLFWQHRGADLAALTRGRLGSAGTALPEADAGLVALLHRLEPEVPAIMRRRPLPSRATRTALQSNGIRPREGGVAGIRQSASLDELDDLLASEFINDRLLLMDRLVNSGFLVRHRPPRRQSRRDVLILGAMPAGSLTAVHRLAKASWIDFIARLAPQLRRAGLYRSDFVWLDGDALGGLAYGVGALPGDLPLPQGEGETLTVESRWRFLWATGWLPGLLDGRRTYPPQMESPEAETAADLATLGARWTAGALRHVRRPGHLAESGGALEVADYAQVHAMVMLPTPPAGLSDGEVRSAVFAVAEGLRFDATRRRSVSLLWCPTTLADLTNWCLALPDRPVLRLSDRMADGTANHIAGALVGHWLSFGQEVLLGG